MFHILPQEDRVFLVTISLVLTVGLLWIHDLCYVNVQRRNSTGLMPPGAIDKGRIVIKLIGLYGTFFIILLLYGLNPFYRETTRTIQFYGYFFSFLKLTAPAIIILSFAYFCFIDRRQKDPYDSYWHMGCVLTGRWRQVKGIFLREHGRVWFIKAFFIPFMFGLLMEYLNAIFSFNWSTGLTFALIYEHSLNIFYTFDVLFGVLGYLLTLRLTDNHVQSTEPTILGWVVCLACYHPFYSLFGIGLLQYQSSFTWEQWLSFNPVLFYGVGLTIMALSAVYGLATVAFGYRMSNLTYRGIITDGPYRFTKHPAYLAKVLSWWLISLPFLSLAGPLVAAKQTLALIVISFIYYFRAKTEENHLANYPEYVQYANWIDQHGIFHTLKKYFPGLRFSQENSRRWNSVVWFKKLG
ncbi:MAG: DUF1295 domain-containing protein [Candidatus Omnitrophica bacterium]|nr:DUF1295 domain-containing protein [Candidatus Omnitrophota bacterium]